MTEEPQLNSIQQRIAALNQSQLARPPGPEPFLRPTPERSASANIPPSYDAVGSVVDRTHIGNEPADDKTQRSVLPAPSMETLRPDVKPKKKPPPPVPTRKADRLPPPTPARPALPLRRPTDQKRRPSFDSVTSDASYSTTSTATTAGRGASTTSVNSNGNNRIKAPAWGETELPSLPPRRPKEAIAEPPPRPTLSSKKSMGSLGGLSSRITSKFNLPGSKPPVPSVPSQPSQPPRPTEPPRPTQPPRPNQPLRRETEDEAPAPRLPPRRPSGVQAGTNATADDVGPSLPIRRTLPPPPSAAKIQDARQFGFGNKSPQPPPRPGSTVPGTPPPIPHGSRPDLSKIMATKPRFDGSTVSSSPPVPATDECLVCRDFSGPDNHAARYPRASLPTQDMSWLANELTSPFSSLTDKARAIFTWLHHNIFYDTHAFFNNCVQPSTPASTLSTGLAVCEGYAGLFAALATKAGLEAVVVGGHGKGFGHVALEPGASVPPYNGNHAWNAVKIDGGRWKLIDSCWGAGCIEGAGQPYKQRFEPAMFSISNEEFGLKHFPENRRHFYREDGRPDLTWEEYVLTDPDRPNGVESLKVYSDADKRTIGRKTFHPQGLHISVSTPGPIRFQFGLLCPHWTLSRHSHIQHAGLFLLMIHGVDGRKDEKLAFTHWPGSGPGGGGELWYVDVPDARMLGAPGQKLQLAVLTSFGDRKDASAVTAEEFHQQVGRVGMAWAYVAEWELVR